MSFEGRLLKQMIGIASPSGKERQLNSFVRKQLETDGYSVKEDAIGNLFVNKPGAGKRIMFAAHMDQIGLMVTGVSEEGFIEFFNLGGLIPASLVAQRVVSTSGIEGVINVFASSEGKGGLGLQDLYLDIGCVNREEAENRVSIGDAFVFKPHYYEDEGIVIAPGIDDKIGCFILLQLLKDMVETAYDVTFVFTVQEEVGTRGAATAAYALEPDLAVSVDITPAGDSPGIKNSNTAIGKGVAIKVMDPSMIAPEHIVKQMKGAAEDGGIKYQLEVMKRGGTDSGAIHLVKSGIPSGVLSIPTRNAHTANELISKFDVGEAIRLLKHMLANGYFG